MRNLYGDTNLPGSTERISVSRRFDQCGQISGRPLPLGGVGCDGRLGQVAHLTKQSNGHQLGLVAEFTGPGVGHELERVAH